jgi:hypothetical protein
MNKLLLLFLLFPLSGICQSAQRWSTATVPASGSNFSTVIPNAEITVCEWNSSLNCISQISIYSDPALTQGITQPLTANGVGVYSYYVDGGTHVVEQVCAPYNQCSFYDVYIGNTGNGSMVYPPAGVPVSTGTAWGSSYSVQGTDSKLLSSGTIGSSGSLLCIDSLGGATTSGCAKQLVLQHNGTNLTDQVLLNFNDTTPTPPTGNVAVTFQSDSGGDLSAYVAASNLATQYVPQGTGQYVLVFGTSCTITNTGIGANPICYQNAAGQYFGGLVDGTGSSGITVSNFTLPSYVTQSNITAVYAFMISASSMANSEFEGMWVNSAGGGTIPGGASMLQGVNGASQPALDYPLGQVSVAFSALPTNYSAIQMNASRCCNGQGSIYIPLMGLEVHYTGTAPPSSSNLLVQPPLYYNSTLNTLGISPNWPNLNYITNIAGLPNPGSAYQSVSFVSDGQTPTDCSVGGGTFSNQINLCYWNGSSYVGFPISQYTSSSIVQSLSATAQTTTYAPSGYATPVAGMYRFTYYVNAVSETSSPHTTLTVTYQNAHTSGNTFTWNDIWSSAPAWDQYSAVFYAAVNTTITPLVTASGTISYDVHYKLEYLGN